MRIEVRRHLHLALRVTWSHPIRQLCSSAIRNEGEDRQLRDIVPGDLQATLEAHRASNRESIIRKIDGGNAKSWGLSLEKDSNLIPGLVKDNDVQGVTRDATPAGEETVRKQFSIWKAKDEVVSAVPEGSSEQKANHLLRKLTKAKQRSAALTRQRIDPTMFSKGRYVNMPASSRVMGSSNFKPWESASSLAETDKMKRFSQELVTLSEWLTLTPTEKSFRQNLFHAITEPMKQKNKDVEFYAFGSSETGLATTMSDIDIGFTIPLMKKEIGERGPSVGLGRPENRKAVFRLLDRFCLTSMVTNKYIQQEIVYARFPLLRMVHLPSKTEIQIVAGSPRPAVIEIIKAYLDEFPQLLPVYLALKATLAARELDEPRLGGVGSYTLLMMIVGAFKLSTMSRLTQPGPAFMTVLKFYAEFVTGENCIALEPPMTFQKRSSFITTSVGHRKEIENDPQLHSRHKMGVANEQIPYLLCLQDPADPDNDLGRSVWRILDIQKTFQELFSNVKGWLIDLGPIAHKGLTPLEFLLGRTLDRVRDHKDSFRLWSYSASGRYEIRLNNALAQGFIAKPVMTGIDRVNEPDQMQSSNVKDLGTGAGHDDYDESMRLEDHMNSEDHSNLEDYKNFEDHKSLEDYGNMEDHKNFEDTAQSNEIVPAIKEVKRTNVVRPKKPKKWTHSM